MSTVDKLAAVRVALLDEKKVEILFNGTARSSGGGSGGEAY